MNELNFYSELNNRGWGPLEFYEVVPGRVYEFSYHGPNNEKTMWRMTIAEDLRDRNGLYRAFFDRLVETRGLCVWTRESFPPRTGIDEETGEYTLTVDIRGDDPKEVALSALDDFLHYQGDIYGTN